MKTVTIVGKDNSMNFNPSCHLQICSLYIPVTHAEDAGIRTQTLGDLLCQPLLEGLRDKVRLGLKYAHDVLNKLKQLY